MMERRIRRVLVLVLIVYVVLIVFSQFATVSYGGGWLTLTVSNQADVVLVKSVCLPGCLQYPVPGGRP